MRVLEPHHFAQVKNKKQAQLRARARRRRLTAVVVTTFVLLLAGLVQKPLHDLIRGKSQPGSPDYSQNMLPVDSPAKTESKKLLQFSGQEFKQLYYSMIYPNSQLLSQVQPPRITGNIDADVRIRAMAEERGYRLTSIPAGAIVRLDEPHLDGDDLLQPLAAESWHSLKSAAHADNIPLIINSAYRSPESQRELFLNRLYSASVNPQTIAAGWSDDSVAAVLEYTAPPGYSRHHTGYTIDLWCEDGSGQFVNSVCYQWISSNNYHNAKLHQWIPSYPDGAELQGPEPEPWEYVWVGRDTLYE